jgi:hypothetical protein
MRVKTVYLVCLAICMLVGVSALAQSGPDPLSGTWTGDWGPSPQDRNEVTVELKWDGKALTGTVNPGPNAIALLNSRFNPKTGEVHMEADAKDRRGNSIHYIIEGKIDKTTMSGSWNHDNRKGDFKITKK